MAGPIAVSIGHCPPQITESHSRSDSILPPDLRDFPLVGRRASTLTACIAVCAGYCVTGAAGLWLLNRIVTPVFAAVAPTLGVPWLAVGVGVGGLLVFGVRAWPGVFAGSCITWAIIQGDAWGPVLIDTVGESLSIVLIVRLLGAWRYQPSLPRYQDALILIAAAASGRLVSSGIDIFNALVAPWLDTRPTAPAMAASPYNGEPRAAWRFLADALSTPRDWRGVGTVSGRQFSVRQGTVGNSTAGRPLIGLGVL